MKKFLQKMALISASLRRGLFAGVISGACMFSCVSVFAQADFWNSPDAYLGQKQPGDTPVIFAQQMLSRNDTFPMDRTAFSNDGMAFYYPTNTTWFSSKNSKIMAYHFRNGRWVGPTKVNEGYYAPTLSIDNKTMYMAGGPKDSLNSHVWQSIRRPDGEWTAPVNYLAKNYGLYMFMPTRSGTMYVGSNGHAGNRQDYGTYDICTLRMTATDTVVTSLGAPINTSGFEGDFYVAPDESYIIFSGKETLTYECELEISFRKTDMTWTQPLSLGPLINDGVAHRWGEMVSPDGKYLFYSHGHGPQDCHILWVRIDQTIRALKARAFQ